MIIHKKVYLAILVVLLPRSTRLYATQNPTDSSNIDNDSPKEEVITNDELPEKLSNLKLTTIAPIAQDLRGADLSKANFAGQRFTHTNFEDAKLEGAILTGTTCDYQQCFKENIKANEENKGKRHFTDLPADLKSIAQVYPTILANNHKAKLLQIASSLAYVPCYNGIEFTIKKAYWSCELLLLKKQLDSALGDQLICSLAHSLEYEGTNYCWATDYPFRLEHKKGVKIASSWCIIHAKTTLPVVLGILVQQYITESAQPKHANFAKYLELFQKRLSIYNVKSKHKWAYNFYKKNIEESIKELAKISPQLTAEPLQKEVIETAHALSESYKMAHLSFLCHYLACQNRLIKLKISAGIKCKNVIHYNLSLY